MLQFSEEINKELFCHKDIAKEYNYTRYNEQDYLHYIWPPLSYTNARYNDYVNDFATPAILSKLNVEYGAFPKNRDTLIPDYLKCFKNTGRYNKKEQLDINDQHSLSRDCLDYCYIASLYTFDNTGIYDMGFCGKVKGSSVVFDRENCLETDNVVNRCKNIVDFASAINKTKFNHFWKQVNGNSEKKYRINLDTTKFNEELDLSSWKSKNFNYNSQPQKFKACPSVEIDYDVNNNLFKNDKQIIHTDFGGWTSFLSNIAISIVSYIGSLSLFLLNTLFTITLGGLSDLNIVSYDTMYSMLNYTFYPLQYFFNNLLMPFISDILLFSKSKILNLIYGFCTLKIQLKVYDTFAIVDAFMRYFTNVTKEQEFAVPFDIFNNHILKQITFIIHDLFTYFQYKIYYIIIELIDVFANIKQFLLSSLNLKIFSVLSSTLLFTFVTFLTSFPFVLLTQIIQPFYILFSFLKIVNYQGSISATILFKFLFSRIISNVFIKYLILQIGLFSSWLFYLTKVVNPVINRVNNSAECNMADNNFFTVQKGRLQKLICYIMKLFRFTTLLSNILEPLIIV